MHKALSLRTWRRWRSSRRWLSRASTTRTTSSPWCSRATENTTGPTRLNTAASSWPSARKSRVAETGTCRRIMMLKEVELRKNFSHIELKNAMATSMTHTERIEELDELCKKLAGLHNREYQGERSTIMYQVGTVVGQQWSWRFRMQYFPYPRRSLYIKLMATYPQHTPSYGGWGGGMMGSDLACLCIRDALAHPSYGGMMWV